MGVNVRGPGLSGILKNVRALTKTEVLVGIPAEAASRSDDDGISNAVIGYRNEFGEPADNLPARPHLIPGVRSAEAPIAKRMEAAGKAALAGDESGMTAQFMAAGLIGESAVKRTITAGLSPALSPVTLHRRKTRKVAPRTGEQPLIDTGAYRNAITHVLRPRGGR